MITEEQPERADRALPPRRRILRDEVWLVLAVSLGASAVSALISFIGSITRPGGLANQSAVLNRSAAPGRPWLDLAWQLFDIATSLVPVLLVAHLMMRNRESLRDLGVDAGQRLLDLGRGALVAAAIGGTGLALYLGARASGANLTVVPTTLPDVWWRIPVLILSAIENAALEEIVVLGYLMHRLQGFGWSFPKAVAASSLLRGSYHLYQGIGGFFGNLAMGVIFCLLYKRWGRVMPLLVAHALIDIVAFVGYVLLAGKVGWLPTP
ncbi:CPBP family glutamic-type intramembrane protease [Streptodolium elevatio]|uniref:CPBP family intramembrane glutamic endopeptidase n=1 Tax=Streptodolium elevatio TaxID=3157996 RepID=UPI003F4D2193